MIVFQIIYFANVLIAGAVGTISLFSPRLAKETVFQGSFELSESIRIIGAFWCAIALLSLCGLFWPKKFVLVFLVQFLYKGLWLLTGALPKLIKKQNNKIPYAMSMFFLIYVLFLPFVIPFKELF